MARILVLGGSYLQNEFISTALRLGHEVVFVDRDPLCFSRRLAGAVFRHLDFSDETKLHELCLKEKINLVIAPSNELGNIVASRLCQKLGFLYNAEEIVRTTTNKYYLREKLSGTKVQGPEHIKYNGNLEETKKLRFPVVVKPSESSAGRGVSSANSESELKHAIEMARIYSQKKSPIIIEELLEGPQFSIETISSCGEHFIVGITKEIVSGTPLFIERSHFMGPEIYEENFEKLNDFTQKLLKELNIRVGPCHIEVIVQKNQVKLVEIGSRSGGLRDLLIKYSGAGDYNELIIKSYLGEKINKQEIHKPKKKSLVNILMYPEDILKYMEAKKDGALKNEFFNGKGPALNPQNLMDAYGYFHAASKNDVFKYSLENDRQ